jgi:hypothetical protein
LRALDPIKFAEALVKLPSDTLDFRQQVQDRIDLVLSAADTHDIIDQAQTAIDHALAFVAGQTILDVNVDNSGNTIGPVWNPTTNSELN